MLNYTKQLLINVRSDFRSWVVGAILSLVAEESLVLTNIIETPIPLRIAIVISLSVLLCCLLVFRQYSNKIPHSDIPIKAQFIIAEGYKWKTILYKDGSFKIDENPYCIKHERRLVLTKYETKQCNYLHRFLKCKSSLKIVDETYVFDSAKSTIEYKIKNKLLS